MIVSKNILKWGCLVALLFVFNSCTIENVSYVGVDGLKFEKLSGRDLSLSFNLTLNNPNKKKIKVKPSLFDLYINENQVGTVQLDQTIEIQPNGVFPIHVPITLNLQQGAIPVIIAGALKQTAKIRVVGKLKGSMYGITKSKKIDETKEISLKNLGDNKLFNLSFF